MTTRALLLAATSVNGLLAGANVDRLSVQLPAFKRLGADDWGRFSRVADLSLNGIIVYPTEGIGGALLTIASALSFMRDGAMPRNARAPIAVATAGVIGGMALTFKAGPNMLRVRHDTDLNDAFRRFRFWNTIRGACQILAFGAA